MLRFKQTIILAVMLAFLTRIALGQTAAGPEDLSLAKRAFEDGFYQIASEHFQKYLQKNPQKDNSEIKILLCRCYINLEKYSESLRLLKEIMNELAQDQFSEETIYWTAQTYFAANDYENALNYFQKMITKPASNFLAESYYYKASCYYKSRQFNQALIYYREFNNKFAKHNLREESSFRIAQCLYNIKDYSMADKEFNRLIKEFPQSAYLDAALHYLGEIEYILGNFEKAVQYYTRAAEGLPKSKTAALAKYARGWAYLKLKDYKEALDEFSHLNKTPKLGKSMEDSLIFAQGRCQSELQNYAEAVQLFEKIINEFPHSSWFDDAYYWKGRALYELGRYPQACQTYEQALEKFSSQAKIQQSPYDQAVNGLEDLSLTLVDNLRYDLGWTYARMKRYEEATVQFEQVFKGSGERFLQSGALCRIADIYLEQEKYKKAIEYYDSVLDEFSDTYYADYAQFQLGIALFRSQEFDSAILAFNTLIANFPQSKFLDQAYYQSGAVYFRQGKFVQAGEQLQGLIEKFPHSVLQTQATLLKAYADYNNKDYNQALKGFSALLRLPTEPTIKSKAQYQIGFCFYQMGKEEKALTEFEKFLTNYPSSQLRADVLFWLGQYHFRQAKFTQAQKYFAEILEDLPQHELVDDALFWQAEVFFGQRKFEPALDLLANIETNYPNSDIIAEALLFKAEVLTAAQKNEPAQDLYKKICTEFPGTVSARIAHKARAEFLQAKGLFTEAIKEYRGALGSASEDFNAQVQFAIAECYQSNQELSFAQTEYLKVYYLYPAAVKLSRQAQLNCAKIFEQQKQWEQAQRIYNELVNAGGAEAEFARSRLKELELTR